MDRHHALPYIGGDDEALHLLPEHEAAICLIHLQLPALALAVLNAGKAQSLTETIGLDEVAVRFGGNEGLSRLQNAR